jgi:hypothetical protein
MNARTKLSDMDAIVKAVGQDVASPPQVAVVPPKKRKAKSTPKKVKKAIVSIDPQGLVDWGNVKGGVQLKENIDGWTGRDFRIYIMDKWRLRFGSIIDVAPAAVGRMIGKLRVLLARTLGKDGEASSSLVKSYVDFYFDKHLDRSVSYHKSFWTVNRMAEQIPVASYAKEFPALCIPVAVSPSPSQTVPEATEAPSVDSQALNPKEVYESSRLGIKRLVQSYGLVVTSNALIKLQKTSRPEQVLASIVADTSDTVSKDKKYWVRIHRATEKYSPYPKWLPFTDVQGMVAQIETKVGFKLKPVSLATCSDDSRFAFLR